MLASVGMIAGCNDSCDNIDGAIFFDSEFVSDFVQDGAYTLTEKGLRERERLFAACSTRGGATHTEMPNFMKELKVSIEGKQITVSATVFLFIRSGNYYTGQNANGFVYFSFDGNILNMLLKNFGVYETMHLQFERENSD